MAKYDLSRRTASANPPAVESFLRKRAPVDSDSINLDIDDDTIDKNVLMKIVSVGYSTGDVKIKRAVLSLLAEIFNA